MEQEIMHDFRKNRFFIKQDELIAFVEYRLVNGTLDILHTIVPRPLSGQGIASGLVRYACDYALSEGLRPVATCPYAVVWLKRHPDYAV